MRSVVQRLRVIGLALLFCLAVVTPSVAASGLVVKPIHVPAQPPTPQDPRYSQLEAEGYEPSDIMTAFDFEWKTGIAASVWLEKYKEAGDWLAVAMQTFEMGVELRNPWRSNDVVTIDESTSALYQEQGYDVNDLYNAAELAHDFGITVDEAFAVYHDRGGWRAAERYLVELAEVAVWGPTYKCAFGGWVGKNGEILRVHPETGMTYLEFCTWTAKGYAFGDIVNASSIAHSHQATMEEVLHLRSQGLEWAAIRNIVPFTESAVAQQTGLEVEQIRKMTKLGFTHKDIIMAAGWAKRRYQTVEEVLQEFDEKGRDWEEYQYLNPTPDDIALTLGWPLEKVLALVRKGAKPLWILMADYTARTEGMSFDLVLDEMIKNNMRRKTFNNGPKDQVADNADPESYEELRKLLKVPASVLIAFSTDEFNTLRGMGFDDVEMAKIGLIAKALKRPAMDVAILKRSGVSWLDLVTQLKKK